MIVMLACLEGLTHRNIVDIDVLNKNNPWRSSSGKAEYTSTQETFTQNLKQIKCSWGRFKSDVDIIILDNTTTNAITAATQAYRNFEPSRQSSLRKLGDI